MIAKVLSGLSAAFLVASCVSTPVPNAALQSARSAVQSTAADPNVPLYAALDLEAAKTQLAIAESAAMHHDDAAVAQPAYLASQTARLAELKASAKADDTRVAAGQVERAQIEMAARNREVANANVANEQATAKAAALKAELEALEAKRNR
jgi:cytoskeletal protein RodZ